MLFIEAASGISGDMTVGALVDLGASPKRIATALDSLALAEEFSYAFCRKTSYGIAGTDFAVEIPAHPHEHGHHHHHHRHLAEVEALIDRGEMSAHARTLAKRAFRFVAEAEAQAHGEPLAEVHFHEVGAIDSIADIVAAAVAFDELDDGECAVTALTEGTGTVRCAHGELPVPVPAVLNIARTSGIPLRRSDTPSELVTPTGIALAATFRTRETLPESFRVLAVGTGLGKRDYGRAAILRILRLG